MKPAWSVILFTTLAGAGQGLFVALAVTERAFQASKQLLMAGGAISLALLLAGLVASFFHLGHPERAWRAVAMWRTSWLSREVIILPTLISCVVAWGAAQYFGVSWAMTPIAIIGVLLSATLFVCTAMIYACLKFVQEWHSALTLANYTALGCASGLTLGAALAAWLEPGLARVYETGALVTGLVAYTVRIASLWRNTRLRPQSTPASAIGARERIAIRQISQGAMGGSYNTREFFHGKTRASVRAVRWAFLALLFPLPALLLIFAKDSAMGVSATFAMQYAGVLAERWYFFAEANHPQNLYYRTVS